MKDYKFLFLLISEFLKRYTWKLFSSRPKAAILKKYFGLAILAGAALAAFLKVGLGSYNTPFVSEGVIGVYTQNNLPSTVANLISEPLIKLDKSGQPQPNLVSGWQVNNNATIYTFKLKDNLFWNDGSKLKSQDLKFNLLDVEISYPDEQTIEFKLADSFAPFPVYLTSPVFKNESLVGVGKYEVNYKELSSGAVVKLILNPKGKNSILPVISIRFYPDEKTARTAFALGEIDTILGISEIGDLKGQPSIKEERIPILNKLTAIFYNTKDPLLSDKNLRRALSYATPAIEGEDKAKSSLPQSSWAYNNEVREYQNNPQTAKAYLEKVELGEGKTITLTTTPFFASLGEKIIQSWKQAGINALLRVESGIPQNFQALLISQPIPYDPDQYTLWHSTQSKTNLSQYSFARVDKDLEDGRKTSDLKVRKEKYFDFQKIIAEDSPATFLYFPKFNVLYRQKVWPNLEKVLSLQVH